MNILLIDLAPVGESTMETFFFFFHAVHLSFSALHVNFVNTILGL